MADQSTLTDQSAIKNQNHKGFTLVEVAIVMVILGLLIGLGTGMIGPLMNLSKSRDTKEFIGAAVESVNSWAASNNRIPDANLTGTTRFIDVAKTTTDSWSRDLIYLYDSFLAPPNATKDTICGRKSTSITISNLGMTPTQTINNVAFVVISQGEDAQIQTTASDGAITASRTVATGSNTTITLDAAVSDIVRWVTLDELRSKIGCQGAQLKILNNELPYGILSSQYPDVYIVGDGGLGSANYQWCIENTAGTAPAGLTYRQNTTGGTILTNIFSSNCSTWSTWGTATQLVVNGTPNAGGSHFFKIFLRDGTTTASNNTSKPFVLTINPQQ